MKNKFLIAIFVLTISLFTFSCTEDPIPEIPSNYLKYNGKYYELTTGYLTDIYMKKFSSGYYVILTGPTIQYDTDIRCLTGCDASVLITLLLPYNSTTIPTTNFAFYKSKAQGSFYYYLGIDPYCVYNDHVDMSFDDQKNDTITITKSGFGYEIFYKGIDQYSIPFEIKYNGPINYKIIYLEY
jgi:hypothetical protein